MKIVKIKKLTRIKSPRYIYETVRGDENAEEKAVIWARKHRVNTLYRFDMGHGIKWIINAEETFLYGALKASKFLM